MSTRRLSYKKEVKKQTGGDKRAGEESKKEKTKGEIIDYIVANEQRRTSRK